MTTAIVILNTPNPHWKQRFTRRFINPDIQGLDLQEASVAIRETATTPWHVISKDNIATITLIFSKDVINESSS